jgi:hypothetical protein
MRQLPKAQHEQIEKLAYQLWEKRGRPLGSPDEDWLRAERHFIQGLDSPLTTPLRFADDGTGRLLDLANADACGEVGESMANSRHCPLILVAVPHPGHYQQNFAEHLLLIGPANAGRNEEWSVTCF